MDLRLTPDLIEIRERSRRFCDEWLIPFEHETEEAGSLSMESYARIRQAVLDARLNAMNMPAEWGGQGFSILQQVVALEQLGRVTNALWACVWRPAQVLEHCTPAQRARFLEPECRGERRYAYAITEPNAGSDVARLETVARRVDGGWSISGEKWFVTDADIADYLIVVAEAEGAGQTCFLVDSDAAGVRETRRPRYMHTFAFEHPEYVFEDCFVPDDQVLGAPGQGNDLSKDWFTDERLMIAARCLGGAERALEIALAYAQERVQFGGPDHRQPGRLVPARRLRRRDRGGARADLPGRVGVRHRNRPQDDSREGLAGQALRQRDGRARRRSLRPGARRPRLHAREPVRAALPRPPRRPHLGGHERDPAHGHRQRTAQARPGRGDGLARLSAPCARRSSPSAASS